MATGGAGAAVLFTGTDPLSTLLGMGNVALCGICMWLTLTNSSSNRFKSCAISVLLYSSCKLIELIIINKFIK